MTGAPPVPETYPHQHPTKRGTGREQRGGTCRTMRAVFRSFRTSGKPAGRGAGSLAVWGIGACFVLWAALFIYRSSVLAFDGNRYFVLFDDSMISMRYGWNLAYGLGLVWNAGEYVDGYTNPLTTLSMALDSTSFDNYGAVLSI